ncbi:hypothetical protein GF312_00035 [Candidatus Poribacteria bacterium]|nr:hypothetical protein [Candidatus Poribacteria bacterium]
MVDIHSHVLPGVDDGAKSMEESIEMLRKAASDGIDIMVATPHMLPGVYKTESIKRIKLTEKLQALALENHIEIQVKPGVEYYFSPEIIENIENLKEFTINNNGKYLLIELPMQDIPPHVEDVFLKIKSAGITPILAHPERNIGICRKPNALYDLVTKGLVTQLNAGSLMGYFGRQSKKTARTLLKHNMIHLVASDMHASSSVTLAAAVPYVKDIIGSVKADHLFNKNPRCVLNGEELDQDVPIRIEKRRKGFLSLLFGRN